MADIKTEKDMMDIANLPAFHIADVGGQLEPLEDTLRTIMEVRAQMLEFLIEARQAGLEGWKLTEKRSSNGRITTWAFEKDG